MLLFYEEEICYRYSIIQIHERVEMHMKTLSAYKRGICGRFSCQFHCFICVGLEKCLQYYDNIKEQ